MMEQANTEVLKEPRGFIRCLQLLLAVVAFSTLANYSTQIAISIICKEANAGEEFNQFTRDVTYPFRVEQLEPINVTGLCKITDKDPDKIGFRGDFSSDAQFLVFTGVISFLYSILSLFVYVFQPSMFHDVNKRNPKIDFLISAVLAMFWLAGAAAWANGLTGLRWAVNTENWLHSSSICRKTVNPDKSHQYAFVGVEACTGSSGSFGGGVSAVLLGFLNFFLWTCNLWYLYKETAWFRGGQGPVLEDRMEAGEVAESVKRVENEEDEEEDEKQ